MARERSEATQRPAFAASDFMQAFRRAVHETRPCAEMLCLVATTLNLASPYGIPVFSKREIGAPSPASPSLAIFTSLNK